MDSRLSETEKYLWKFITKNINKIPNLSIVKLSELANVSTSTIVRTMKKKGYEGFTAFKHHLKDEQNTTINFSNVEKIDTEIKSSILKNEQEVIRTLNMINTGVIEDAIQKMESSERIIIFARAFSEFIAEEMKIKFQLANKYCELHTDPNIIKIMSQHLKKTDTVIFVSLNGETEELIDAAKNCYNKEIGTITITTNKESPLSMLSELVLVGFKSEISFFPDYEVRSRLPLSVIARILLDSYVIRMNKHHENKKLPIN
ncbi:MurR/RpiR family transcriptional regulator [Listeria welshimeri]|uniref:MurR/RpiR family transcriptional regulator n=1 Tax=Listeria welshimeri TaxID=1643 RepID=UPI001625A17B|nr:MurR/RpiR family transcriptional regulator [Listeria welshimeri]MBC1981526.1 MurR/RpiR family transcriptional regulator [Listeria welshimeri]MBC2008438.1 MurR/RpiR family transcriptional regulator [Listeria welshimeri]MBC2027114.1 MurR/RpiR family transcriptional regulator [Listeria welshimeri]MBC2042802.1 MurR/RpiR family transcriptional regulator [Listeria welshimeri]MBC2065357.1 MurR/RpiR family transcriptional regulator [Listeria welshimeri]